MVQEDSKVDEVMETGEDIEVSTTPAGVTVLSLKLLPMTKLLQSKHGLRHGDYQRYRGYCSRRLARLRKVLKIVQGERKKFTKKEVTSELLQQAVTVNNEISSEAKHLQVPLMSAERAWSYAMQLKFEMNSEARKKFHMINRLRKAKVHADALEQLCADSTIVDARSKLETQAYAYWITGNLHFETNNWAESLKTFNLAKAIYEKLGSTLNEEEAASYQARIDEIAPNLRFCAYNIGDASAKQDLLAMRGGQHGLNDLDDLINQTREQQTATLQEVEWRGRKLPVKQEKIRIFLLREQEFNETEVQGKTFQDQISAYEGLLMDCKDALQTLRDELIEDPTFRNRQQASEGPVAPVHFLYTYLTFMKSTKTIDRNYAMIEEMKSYINGEKEPEKGKKPIKPQDLVRLYDTVMQNYNDIPQLAGLEEDLALKQEMEAKIVCCKALKCYYIALTYLNGQKWPEARALFQRATIYANKAKNDTIVPDSMREGMKDLMQLIESKQFMAHANSILEAESNTTTNAGDKVDDADKSAIPLIDRLDDYFEDPNLVSGKPNLYPFPPNFEPIPCKPLFFDLAREHVEFPSLDEKISVPGTAASPQGASGGWLGGWLGGWSKK